MKKQFLAFLCRICPVCNIVRWKPDSGFAKKMIEAEKNCPACKAYHEVYGCGAKTK
jgi:rubrerythrin